MKYDKRMWKDMKGYERINVINIHRINWFQFWFDGKLWCLFFVMGCFQTGNPASYLWPVKSCHITGCHFFGCYMRKRITKSNHGFTMFLLLLIMILVSIQFISIQTQKILLIIQFISEDFLDWKQSRWLMIFISLYCLIGPEGNDHQQTIRKLVDDLSFPLIDLPWQSSSWS